MSEEPYRVIVGWDWPSCHGHVWVFNVWVLIRIVAQTYSKTNLIWLTLPAQDLQVLKLYFYFILSKVCWWWSAGSSEQVSALKGQSLPAWTNLSVLHRAAVQHRAEAFPHNNTLVSFYTTSVCSPWLSACSSHEHVLCSRRADHRGTVLLLFLIYICCCDLKR